MAIPQESYPDLALRDRLAELLTQGCDDRIVIDPKTGMHKYNGTNVLVPGFVCRFSCTFSIRTEETFNQGHDFLQMAGDDSEQIEAMTKKICDRLRKVWCASEAVLTLFPAGTDAEFLPLLVALG